MSENKPAGVMTKEFREELKKWIDKLDPELVKGFYDMVFMREGPLKRSALKAVFEFGDGTKKAIQGMIKTWADSAYAVENIVRSINMGPVLTWNLLKHVEPTIDQIAFIKSRIIGVPFRDLLFDSEGATGFSLGAPITHLIGALGKLGIDISYDISIEAIKPERGLTFFKADDIWSSIDKTVNMTFKEQFDSCYKDGGSVANLEQILDYMLDVTIKNILGNPYQDKGDMIRHVINFFVRPSSGGNVMIRTSSQGSSQENQETCTLVFDAISGKIELINTHIDKKAPNLGVILVKKTAKGGGIFTLHELDK